MIDGKFEKVQKPVRGAPAEPRRSRGIHGECLSLHEGEVRGNRQNVLVMIPVHYHVLSLEDV